MAFLRKLSALGGLQLAASNWRLMTPAKTASGMLSECSRSIASTTNENAGMQKLYKSLGMKPPLPRKVTPDAQKLHDELFNRVSRPPRDSALRRRAKKQRINYSTISHSHHSMGKQPAVLGAEVPSASMIRMLSSDSTTAEEDQVDRILDAGAERLFKSEDGRQRIRNGSFNIDETAKTMLEAATEALEEGEGAECSDDSSKAKDACEEIKRGGMDVGKVAQRVKEKVTGLGQAG